MQERLKQLEDSFNTNTKVFSDGIQMLEAQNATLRKIIQGLLDGAVIKDGDGKIAYSHYLRLYIEELAEAEAKAEEQKTTTPAGPILATPDEDAPIVFGGTGQ